MQKIIPIRKDVRREPGERMDGWSNLVTLLGTNADKRMASRLHWENRGPEFYEELYAGGGISARIVDLIPDEALREGWDWLNVEPEQKEQLNERCQDLDVRGAILKTWKWARAYGGACLHIVTDTKDPASPLRRGERVLGLRDLSRWDLRVLTTDVEYDFGSPNFGHPRIYYLNVQMGSQYKGYPIHWTRMIRFDGQLVPRRTFIRNNYWHDAVLNRVYDAVRDYQVSNDAAAACLQDFNVDVFAMKNLANLIASGKEKIVKARIETMMFAKSVLNAMVIDADMEQYENKSRELQGVADLLDRQANRLVSETDIPHTKLLGESPDGSNATGNSTSQNWYNFISAEQKNYLTPKLKRLQTILFPEIPKLSHKFHPLRKLDAIEESDLKFKTAQTDHIYIEDGVVDASEITDSRFGGEEYSTDTTLDEESRAAGLIVSGQPGGGMPGGDPNDPMGGGAPQDPNAGPQGFEPPAALMQEPGTEGEAGVDAAGDPTGEEGQDPMVDPGAQETDPEASGEVDPELDPNADIAEEDDGQAPAEETADPEMGDDFQEAEDPSAAAAASETVSVPGAENQGEQVSEFGQRNEQIEGIKNPKPIGTPLVSQSQSLPMRDPAHDDLAKGPGIPNKQRTFLPTRGTGITAPSGFDMEKDAGQAGGFEGQESEDDAEDGPVDEREDAAPQFEESKHKRAEGGKFGSGGGGAPSGEEEQGGGDDQAAAEPQEPMINPSEGGGIEFKEPNSPAEAAQLEQEFKAHSGEMFNALKTAQTPEARDQVRAAYQESYAQYQEVMGPYINAKGSLDPTQGKKEPVGKFTAVGEASTFDAFDAERGLKRMEIRRKENPTQAERDWYDSGAGIHALLSERDDASWDEGKHKRGKGGQFGAGSQGKPTKGKPAAKPGAKPAAGAKPKPGAKKPKAKGKPKPKAAPAKEHGQSLVAAALETATKASEKVQEPAEEKQDAEGGVSKRAATIIVRKGDHFLMGKRRDNGRWSLPGGHVERGESHHQGAMRELGEETGFQSKRLKFLGARMVEPKQGETVHLNMYQHTVEENARPTSKQDPDKEFAEYRWVHAKNVLPEDIADNLQHPNNVALQHLGLLR